MSVLWDPQRASELAREAYLYVAQAMPKGADLGVLSHHEEAALEAQREGNWTAYEEALREMCRVAKREALKRRGAA